MTTRTINCPVYGVITLTPRMCKIVDTPEFQTKRFKINR